MGCTVLGPVHPRHMAAMPVAAYMRAPVKVFTKICIAAELDLPSGEEV